MRIVPSIPCHQVPARKTWEQEESAGYFYADIGWVSLQCYPGHDFDAGCRKDVEILFLGDSNLRGHYYMAADAIPCDHILKAASEKWHKPLLCLDKENNVTLRWLPHSNPFKTYATQWADPLNDLIPSNVAIDNIPTTGRYLVVLNHYLHITGQHISAYVDKMITIKNSLLNAFARNPIITVVLQGPHIVTREGSYRGGDMMIRFIHRIHMDVFKELKDKVLYYPVLDMTIASRNNDTHPEAYVRREWTRYLFALMCNRLNGSS
uniref:NXPE C-terminal domain-containing protein n=1 Tax=Biomphalaria glabrata TaxID=6526 RepID=A0A2C9LM20_BIOGL